MRCAHKKTKKEIVNYALEELVKRHRRKRLLEIEGRVAWKGDLEEMRKNGA
jgi:Arc/MetJ family transcription regulator